MDYKEFRKTLNKCPFCDFNKEEMINENDSAFVMLGRAPYNKDHLLVVPKKHILRLSELNEKERRELFELIFFAQKEIGKRHENFSILYREGENSGKSISHVHFNIIPNTKVGPIDKNTNGEYVCLDMSDRYVYSDKEYSKIIKEFNETH
jgi:diadenosine tetraphosphate (Ap4A) HIT family hydrolase